MVERFKIKVGPAEVSDQDRRVHSVLGHRLEPQRLAAEAGSHR